VPEKDGRLDVQFQQQQFMCISFLGSSPMEFFWPRHKTTIFGLLRGVFAEVQHLNGNHRSHLRKRSKHSSQQTGLGGKDGNCNCIYVARHQQQVPVEKLLFLLIAKLHRRIIPT